MSPDSSVEHLAPNICAIRQISVDSGFVSSGMTLEKRMWTPSKTSERIRGMMRYKRMVNGQMSEYRCLKIGQDAHRYIVGFAARACFASNVVRRPRLIRLEETRVDFIK